jgi:hypothetical protein
MTITNEDRIANAWKDHVRELYQRGFPNRHRTYALTPDSQRHLVQLYWACKDACDDNSEAASKLFKTALEGFCDAGCNVLQPRPIGEIKPPEVWRDVFGNVLPNPFLKRADGKTDVKGQTLVTQRDPWAAQWLRKFAEDLWAAAAEWQDLLAETQTQRDFTYNSDSHAANPYTKPNLSLSERSKFEKEHPDLVARLKTEAIPVAFPVGTNYNLTIQSRIAKTPQLAALLANVRRQEEQHVAQSEAAIRAAQAHLKELESART